MHPFFSIIIATYQRREIVTETIRNVLRQRHTDFEIILVDDGSSDGTAEHVAAVFAHEPRLRIISQTNKERGAARNTGIRSATGDYLVFMDSDDRIDEDHLAVLYDRITKNNRPHFLTTKFDFIRGNKRVPTPVSRLKEGYYDYKILLRGNIIGMYSCVLRSNSGLVLFEEDRKYSILEDWMFNLSNLRHSSIYLVDKTTYHIVDHAERSMTADLNLVAERMQEASGWILEHVELDSSEQRILKGYSAYFSAMNSFQAKDKKAAWRYLRDGLRATGWRSAYLPLIIRLLLGRHIRFKPEGRR